MIATLLLVAVVSLVGGVTAIGAPGALAQEEEPAGSTTSAPPAEADPDIIPRPNSGQEPEEAGDRGGALQLLLLAFVVAAVGVIVALVVRDSRRAAARSPRP